MKKPAKKPATSKDYADFRTKHGDMGVGLSRDDKGIYVHTHRARSKSYPSAAKIPKSVVKFIDSTG